MDNRLLARCLIVGIAGVLIAACDRPAQRPALPTSPPTPTPARPTPTAALTSEAEAPTTIPESTKDATANTETWSSTSPDGKWIAAGFLEGRYLVDDVEKYHTQLKIVSADGAVEWIAVDEMRTWGLGYTTPEPFQWSRDGRYLYYTNLPRPDGCALFVNGSDLHRVDLTDGSVTEIVPDVGPALSLSPDEKTLAYISWGAGELAVRDLASGSERRVMLSDVGGGQAGNIVWSPDGSGLMLVMASQPCIPPEWTQAIVRVNVSELSVTTLISDDDRLFSIVDWSESARVRLSDKDGSMWWLDAETGQLTPTQ